MDIDIFCSWMKNRIVSQSYWLLAVTFQWDDNLAFFPILHIFLWWLSFFLMLDANIGLDCLGAYILLQDFDKSVLVIRLE